MSERVQHVDLKWKLFDLVSTHVFADRYVSTVAVMFSDQRGTVAQFDMEQVWACIWRSELSVEGRAVMDSYVSMGHVSVFSCHMFHFCALRAHLQVHGRGNELGDPNICRQRLLHTVLSVRERVTGHIT